MTINVQNDIITNISLLQTGHTALQRASAEGHVPIINTLLENGVSVDHQDEVVSFNVKSLRISYDENNNDMHLDQ